MMTCKMVAANPKVGLTVADLAQWVQACDTLQVDPRTPVRVVVGMRGQVKELRPEGA